MTNQESIWKRLIVSRSLSIFVVFIVLIVLFTVFSPQGRFLDPENLKVLLAYGSEFSIIALGAGFLMVTGEFDLSVGSILVFCSFAFLKFFGLHLNLFVVLALTVGVGALLGLLNAMITVKGQIPSFVATLGTMMLWRGLTLWFSGGEQQACDVSSSPAFVSFLNGNLGNFFPIQAMWFIVFGIILGVILHLTRLGNWIYSTGDNADAARAMGIRTDIVKMLSFMVVGILCAFVAGIQISRVSCFTARTGEGWELKAVAACVVGGTSLRGGIGNMSGIFLGAFTISVIENGLVVLRIPYFWTYVVFGLVIIFSVLSSMYIERQKWAQK
ncbi:MAG: ABC transporter permease [Atribacterota bacterium]